MSFCQHKVPPGVHAQRSFLRKGILSLPTSARSKVCPLWQLQIIWSWTEKWCLGVPLLVCRCSQLWSSETISMNPAAVCGVGSSVLTALIYIFSLLSNVHIATLQYTVLLYKWWISKLKQLWCYNTEQKRETYFLLILLCFHSVSLWSVCLFFPSCLFSFGFRMPLQFFCLLYVLTLINCTFNLYSKKKSVSDFRTVRCIFFPLALKWVYSWRYTVIVRFLTCVWDLEKSFLQRLSLLSFRL